MQRHIKPVIATLAAITLATLNSVPADAGGCGRGRSGGYVRAGIGVARFHRGHRPYLPASRTAAPHRVYSQPVVQPQPFQPPQPTQPVVSATLPATPQVSAQQPLATAPAVNSGVQVSQRVAAQGQPNQPQTQSQPVAQQPASNVSSPNTPPTNEASALKLLASIAGEPDSTSDAAASIPEFSAAPASTANPHAGTWNVNLPGNQSVELVLNENGSFRWTATKNGKSSNFDGQYRLDNGRLTLVRSNDLQQMAGTWTGQGTNFTFKLDGATNAGLAFVRS